MVIEKGDLNKIVINLNRDSLSVTYEIFLCGHFFREFLISWLNIENNCYENVNR